MYGGDYSSWSGSNVTPSADISCGTTFSVTTAGDPWSLEITTRDAGVVETIDVTETIDPPLPLPRSLSSRNNSCIHERSKVQNTSNPVAAATGNVTNQAVQFQNNGAPSRQIFGANNSCNGATMTFSPFYMGNDTIPYEADGYVRSNNYGMQMSFMIPLDGSMIEQCKQIARRHEQTMRLQYELTRALKCTEIMKAGFTFRPGSRVEVICHDIVPIVSITNSEQKVAVD